MQIRTNHGLNGSDGSAGLVNTTDFGRRPVNPAVRPAEMMLRREDVVGHRINRIVADLSLSDGAYNHADFICVLGNGIAFRLPFDDESDDIFPAAEVSAAHAPVIFPKRQWPRYFRRLWRARIADVLVPADPELRFPDSSRVALTSGWYLGQMYTAPAGILPIIDLMPDLRAGDEMVTVWEANRSTRARIAELDGEPADERERRSTGL